MKCGILPLEVETYHFYSIPEENRKCHLFDLGGVEKEMHFLFFSPLYDNLKYNLFLKMSAECPDFFPMSDECRLQYLFTDKVFHLAQFVLNAYEQPMRALYV